MKQNSFKMKPIFMIIVPCALVIVNLHVLAEANSDRVMLEDVKVLTLHKGQTTKARRASPVPQLKCVGGTAGCTAFKPEVVQCYNRGSDGYDVQWECKTDMDNSYRFGKLQVSCEGYNYPDDAYVLRGSCGLEYELDLTEEGWERKNSGGYKNDRGRGHQYSDDYHYRGDQSSIPSKFWSVCSDLFKLGVIAFIIYIIYKSCIATPAPNGDEPPPSYEDTFRQQGPGNNSQPPPYGFRQDYMPNQGHNAGNNYGGGCASGAGYSSGQSYTSPPGGSTGGGFWSGAFTGGILGYLMGNRNNGGYYTRHRPHTGWWGRNNWGTGWGNGWGNSFGTGWGNTGGSRTYTTTRSSGFGGGSRSSSSGTRTASGFGGTTRR